MKRLATLLVALVALLHLGFLVIEMFLWTTPFAQTSFNMTERLPGLGRARGQSGA